MCGPDVKLAKIAGVLLTNSLRWAVALERRRRRLALARGAVTALEYALMASLIAVAIAGGVAGYTNSLGTYMSNTFSHLASAM